MGKEPRDRLRTFFRLILGVICLLWVVALTRAACQGITRVTANSLILLVGIGLTAAAAVLWLAHVTGAQRLPRATARAIWVVLISSILAVSATAYKTIIAEPPRGLIIEKFRLLENSGVQKGSVEGTLKLGIFKQKQTPIYAPPPIIPFAAVVSGFGQDDAGLIDMQAEALLCGSYASGPGQPCIRVAQLIERPSRKRERLSDWAKTEMVSGINPDDMKSILGDTEGKFVLVGIMLCEFPLLEHGHMEFRLVIRDRTTGCMTEHSEIVQVSAPGKLK